MGNITGREVENYGERSTDEGRDFNFGMQFDVYRWAASFGVDGKTVADVGSGTGYGSRYFAENGAEKVNGFEISEKAIEYSKVRNADLSQIAYHPTNLNNPLSFAEKHDVVFSSNVFEHLTDIPTAIKNVTHLMADDAKFFLAIPCINTPQRLSGELKNQYHYANLSVRFWQETLRKCFSSVKTFVQALHTTEDFYNRLGTADKASKEREFSSFVEILGTPGFDEQEQFVFSYANIAFICEGPTGVFETADFKDCPASSIREMTWKTDPLTGWTETLSSGQEITFPLKATGHIGGVQIYLGDCNRRGSGPVELKLNVRDGNDRLLQTRSKIVDLQTLFHAAPTPVFWEMHRDPLFVADDATISITVRSYAHGYSVFNIGLGEGELGQDDKPVLAWVFRQLAPLPA